MEDFLNCNICFIRYDESNRSPRQLPCQHVFCTDCLSRMVKRETVSFREYVECPMCKEKCFKRVIDIPKSLVMTQLIEAAKKSGIVSNQQANAADNANFYPNFAAFHPLGTPNELKNPPAYSQVTSNISPPSYQSTGQWDCKSYLRQIFNEMDSNRDGTITAEELQMTLRRAQANSEFSIKTVELLISRYDMDGDKQIDFDEFFDLFNSINDEFEAFLLTDSDGSGLIDLYEFQTSLRNKGYSFSDQFFQYLMSEICTKTKKSGIQFDNYIRVAARFDYLCNFYHNTPYFQKSLSLEEYLRKTFFQDFW